MPAPKPGGNMTAVDILSELKRLGNAGIKKTVMSHGVKEPYYGVKIEDMKKILKRTGKQYELALDLYDSGVFDAMYLAGLIADESKLTKKDLEHWVKKAYCTMLSEYTVPWVAAESDYGWEVGLKWIESKDETIASAGWSTLSSLAGYMDDSKLDLEKYKQLLDRVAKSIHDQPNRVRYTMNGFVISVGCYIKPLNKLAVATAKKIGPVSVSMGGTACKVPFAPDYIKKVEARGSLGKKRKTTRC
jgi:3-methyladenine DNA glycosylase AlkD